MGSAESSQAADGEAFPKEVLAKLSCPVTHQSLIQNKGRMVSADGTASYGIDDHGIPVFADEGLISDDAARQRAHYDKVAAQYVTNLGYPHTQEYMDYLDREFESEFDPRDLCEAVEICCGHGELLDLCGNEVKAGRPGMVTKGISFLFKAMQQKCRCVMGPFKVPLCLEAFITFRTEMLCSRKCFVCCAQAVGSTSGNL